MNGLLVQEIRESKNADHVIGHLVCQDTMGLSNPLSWLALEYKLATLSDQYF